MTVVELVEALSLEVLVASDGMQSPISGGCAGDLLSDVLARLRSGEVWITVQTHPNVVGVAARKQAAAVVFTGGAAPSQPTLVLAHRERVTLLSTPRTTFEVSGHIFEVLQRA